MAKEIRVFIADPDTYHMNLNEGSDLEDVMECAESQGTVYSLPNFLYKFNVYGLNREHGIGELKNENAVMRMAEFEDGQFIRELGV